MRLLLRNLPVVLSHSRLAMRDIYARLYTPSPVLRVSTDDFKAITVDAACQRMPKGILDHARKAVHGVLGEAGLIEDNTLAVVVARESKLLKEIGQHIG